MASVNPYTFNHVVRGYYGETFTGTPDLFPSTLTAGKEYTTTLSIPMPDAVDVANGEANNTEIVVMLFDGNTDKLLNAYKVKPTTADAIEETIGEGAATVSVTGHAGNVIVTSPANAAVSVYTLDGRQIAKAQGSGTITLPVAQSGVAIVRVATANGTTVKKVIL